MLKLSKQYILNLLRHKKNYDQQVRREDYSYQINLDRLLISTTSLEIMSLLSRIITNSMKNIKPRPRNNGIKTMTIYVRNNDVDKAMRILKKKLHNEGMTKEYA